MMIEKIVVLFFESLTKYTPFALIWHQTKIYNSRRELCYCWSNQIKRSIRQYIYDMISVAMKKMTKGRKVLKHGTHFYSIHCLPLDLLLKVMSLSLLMMMWFPSFSCEVSCVYLPHFPSNHEIFFVFHKKEETGGRILISQVFLILLFFGFYCFSVLTTEKKSRRKANNKQPTQKPNEFLMW